MAFSIEGLQTYPENDETEVYNSLGFRNFIEDHLTLLRSEPTNNLVEIGRAVSERFRADLGGLLTSREVHERYHFIISRVNNLNSPGDWDGTKSFLIVPESDVMNRYIAIYTTSLSRL